VTEVSGFRSTVQTVDTSGHAVALAEARRALDQQVGDLAKVRDRMTGIAGAGALAGGFIGGLAIDDGVPFTVWTVVGAVAFAGLLVIAVIALWPRDFVFSHATRSSSTGCTTCPLPASCCWCWKS
jgi:hypothetical protein